MGLSVETISGRVLTTRQTKQLHEIISQDKKDAQSTKVCADREVVIPRLFTPCEHEQAHGCLQKLTNRTWELMPEDPPIRQRPGSASSAASERRLSADWSTRGGRESTAKRLARKVRQFQPAQACRGTQLAGSGFLQSDTWGKEQVWWLEAVPSFVVAHDHTKRERRKTNTQHWTDSPAHNTV